MELPKLPSILKNRFNRQGLAKTDSGLLAPAYIASQLGFSESGRRELAYFHKKFEEVGIYPLCPFTACGEYLDFSRLAQCKTIEDQLKFWDDFNKIVGPVNYGKLMPKSKLMIAILDGGHALDDGVCSEIGYYAAKYKGEKPIVAIRTDFRFAENPAAPINPAVRYFLDQGPYNGYFFNGPNAEAGALERIADLAKRRKACLF